MNKKLLALMAVTAVGVSVAGATPQTQFDKGEVQVDLGAAHSKSKTNAFSSDAKWNFDGGVTYALTDKTAVQYAYHGLKDHFVDFDYNDKMHEVNLIQSLNKNFAVYGGYGRISGDDFVKANNIAQAGVIGKANLGSKVDVYGKAGVGTKKTTTWEAGLGFKATDDLDINAGYRYINTRRHADDNISFQGPVVGLSYRFGGSKVATPVSAPAPAPTPAYTPAPAPTVQEAPKHETPKLDYYVQSIYFDSDQSTPRYDQAPNLDAALKAANKYSQDQVKLMGNADTDANPQYNINLSERRVQSVAQFLVNNGVAANRLIGVANGDAKPVATNSTSSGKAENRRVDVYIHR
ncbi:MULTISPECIES: OmpA family protein [Veillonella]|uniref:Flagellar motor protein MotB n=1 Tax=Veillonella denticariosi JCM 15641 TaxID=1298594 RepID=A0A2S7ZDB9_9FIRM|nr:MULTISPECIES: OmpA family protein [Veillonella]ETS91652.1 outer membrane protein beta-barrel domain protein [Veillonella sp. AS16]PQL21225.1 flagellar motor protein MotB [Veillonella denticariosi JCM 15641]